METTAAVYPSYGPLNDLFGVGYKMVMGKDHREFSVKYGQTPFSTYSSCIGIVVLYYIVIFGGQELMRNRKPITLPTLFKAHNLFLTAASVVMFSLFMEQMVPQIIQHGFTYSVCDINSPNQQVDLLHYINYLLKYYELLDTVFLVLKKKKLDFLHYFHHSMTAALTFVNIQERSSTTWFVVTLNLGIHIMMYWFYYETSRGKRPWWKQWLTTGQIVQFVLDLIVMVGVAGYNTVAQLYFPQLPHHKCSNSAATGSFGLFLICCYLVLFCNFYTNTYYGKSLATTMFDAATGKKSKPKNADAVKKGAKAE
ncbi:GNS1/SUR4 membrane protein [Ramicandelaber brevisporus]|nr:GNS1/SUR4 membrane protein [Ramicandelaber brevisporus]